MTATVQARLARAKELLAAQNSLDYARQDDQIEKVTALKRTVVAIRADLLGRKAPGMVGSEVMDAAGTARRAIDHMAELRAQDAPEDRLVEDALILNSVLSFSARVAATTSQGAIAVADAREAASIGFDPQAFNAGQFDRFSELGTAARSPEVLRDLQAGATAFLAEVEVLKEKTGLIKGELMADFDAVAVQREGESRPAYNERRYHAWEKFKELEKTANGEYVEALAKAKRAHAAPAKRVVDEILAASTVTEAQAKAWAAGQVITKSAAARLKKTGYPVDQVRADMAEFCRLTGGRLRTVVISTDGGRRANADGIHGHGSAVINIGEAFSKRTLWHELGHHTEADPAILASARGFLARRADGSGLHSMRDLTDNRGYRADEKAYRDSFFSHYVGKYYKDATEVMSMALESFSDLGLLGQRMLEDPEIFSMVEGILKTTENPLMQLIHAVRAENADAGKEQATIEADRREEFTREIAGRISLVPVNGDLPVNQEGLRNFLHSSTYRHYGVGDAVGYYQAGKSYDVYVVWRAAKVKEYLSGTFKRTRAQKGFMVTRMSAADGEGFFGNARWDDIQIAGTNVDDAKVAIYRWVNSGGFTPRTQPSLSELKQYASSRD